MLRQRDWSLQEVTEGEENLGWNLERGAGQSSPLHAKEIGWSLEMLWHRDWPLQGVTEGEEILEWKLQRGVGQSSPRHAKEIG